MPGQQLVNAWIGNRAELLAAYVLSTTAAVTHVRRENDYGFDLLCTLISRRGHVVRAGRAFGVQVKSSADHGVSFGGLDKNGNWKQHEIDWLFSQDQPMLIVVADIQNWKVRLYSTQRMWYLRFRIGLNPGAVILIPDEELPSGDLDALTPATQERYHERQLASTSDGKPAGNGVLYQVPLGKPIAVISVDENEEELSKIRSVVSSWVDLDYENIQHKDKDWAYILEWADWETNSPPEKHIAYSLWNSELGANLPNLLRTIAPAVQLLMLNLDAQNLVAGATAVIPLAKWIHANGLMDSIGIGALKALEDKLQAASQLPAASPSNDAESTSNGLPPRPAQ